MSDQGSYILCPPDADSDEFLVYKAGLPVLPPPDAPEAIPPDVVNKSDDKEGEHPKGSFDKPMGGIDLDIKDLDEDDDDFLLSAEVPVDDKHKQATTHINFTSDQVLKSTGETREEWLNAGQNEIDNLTVSRTEGQKKDSTRKGETAITGREGWEPIC